MEFDYKSFMQDFRIAEQFGGIKEIKDTFNRCHSDWKNNADYYASFVMTLNHLLWYHYENGNMKLAEVYEELWEKADLFVYENFDGEELQKILAFLD